jgi:translocator protein
MNKAIKLIISIAVCQSAGIIGSFFTISAISTWYAGLTKPVFSPPSWVFAPAWTLLYTLMGIALFMLWLSWQKTEEAKEKKKLKIALFFFGFQLFLNAIWSIIFFGLKNPFWALVEIIFLWLAILLTILFFWKISKIAALLLVPYILWVSFASFLNYSIWYLNAEQSVTMEKVENECLVKQEFNSCSFSRILIN